MKTLYRRMLIMMDVDSVIADLGPAWLARYNKDYDDRLTNQDIKSWDMHLYVKPECGIKIYDYLKDPTLYDDVIPMLGASNAVLKLREYGRIYYATMTPMETAGVKYEWLLRYQFLDSPQDYVELHDKSLLKADVMFDDRVLFIKQRPAGFNVLFDQPWNEDYDYPIRLHGWYDKRLWRWMDSWRKMFEER